MATARAAGRVGIVREVYNKWERRAPLCPHHVAGLVAHGVPVTVQPSSSRIFDDSEYLAAGADLSDDLAGCEIILGVKQMRPETLVPNKTHLFFSHVIKAQAENMPLLDTIRDKQIRLIDYECIADASGNRLVAFGEYAGLAGMINTLRMLGEKLLCRGFSTPFTAIGSAYMYPTLAAAKAAVRGAGEALASVGLPAGLEAPLTFAFTGDGNVSKGAREIFGELPHEMVDPADFAEVARGGDPRKVYGAVFRAQHMVRRDDGRPFDRGDYYSRPRDHRAVFHETVLPHSSVLVNCMYWDPRFPRLISNDQLLRAVAAGRDRLVAVGDLTCDVKGSIQFLTRTTSIERPFFNWTPAAPPSPADALGLESDTVEADGVAVLGVDILPSELPREASDHFGTLLAPYVRELAALAGSPAGLSTAALPPEIGRACIAADGELLPAFRYIDQMRGAREAAAERPEPGHRAAAGQQGRISVEITGHVFDSGLINQVLDLMESEKVDFQIVETLIGPNRTHGERKLRNVTSVLFDVDAGSDDKAAALFEMLAGLIRLVPQAEAEIARTDRRPWEGDFRPRRPLSFE